MQSLGDQRLREALVVGSLLAPEGAAAYSTARRCWLRYGDALVGMGAGG
jgi:hypothetical protein